MRTGLAISSFSLSVAVLAVVGPARAQNAPPANVLRTSTTGDVDAALADGFDREVRARLSALHALSVTSSLPLDLTDLQLALGCEGETDACLGAIASQAGVQILVLPNVTRAAGETIVSLTVYDAHATPATRRAIERLSGPEVTRAAIAAVPTLVEHVFPSSAADAPPTPSAPTPHHDLSPWPFVLAAAGVVSLGVGIGFGVATLSANDAYGNTSTQTSPGVDAALAHLDEARTDATVANVMFVVGGLLTAAGVAWLVVDLLGGSDTSHASRTASLLPAYTRGGGLLVLTGTL